MAPSQPPTLRRSCRASCRCADSPGGGVVDKVVTGNRAGVQAVAPEGQEHSLTGWRTASGAAVNYSMPYVAQVLQILIASPGDVNDERELITQVIHEWNYLNSRERSVVLLPLRWETHAYPEMNTAPQTAINKQVVDHCDMAIGVFWTRLGTPTETAESGTAEEIARVAQAGKPVMLYFSEAKIRPQSIDLDQYKKLMEFKSILTPNALIEAYSTVTEFRDKLRMQLDRQVRDIISQDSAEQSGAHADSEMLTLGISPKVPPPQDLSSVSSLRILRVTCVDRDQIPDYTSNGTTLTTGSSYVGSYVGYNFTPATAYGMGDIDYYREAVDYYCEAMSRSRLWLAVANSSDRSVRDIHLDIKVKASGGPISINPPGASFPTPYPKLVGFLSAQEDASDASESIAVEDISNDEWRIEADIPVVQASRTVLSPRFFSLQARESGQVTFSATTYSSDALPFTLNAELQVVVEPVEFPYRQILKQMIPGYGEGVSEAGSVES
jgi:hypothetical protein